MKGEGGWGENFLPRGNLAPIFGHELTSVKFEQSTFKTYIASSQNTFVIATSHNYDVLTLKIEGKT